MAKDMAQHHEKAKMDDMPAWRRLGPLVIVNKWVTTVETFLNLAGACLIAFVMFFTATGIIMRYAFNAPIYGKVEITELVMAGLVFFGLAYTQRIGGHVRMSFVVERYIRGRARHVVESLTLLFSLFTFVVITISTLDSTLYDLKIHGITSNLYLPTWPSMLCIPLGSLFLCVRLTVQSIQHICQAVVGVERSEL